MSTFVGSSLFLEKVAQQSVSQIRVTFSQDPLAVSASGANDALNPSNYTVSGNSIALVTTTEVTNAFILTLNAPLTTGVWSVTVSNIKTAGGSSLSSPVTLSFSASALFNNGDAANGAASPTAKDVLRQHIPPTIAGPGVDALLTGLGTGDEYLFQLAQEAFNQLFISSSNGKFLDRKGSNYGVHRPLNVGLSDDVFRQLISKTTSEKLTLQSLLQILEIFYGQDATRAHCTSTVAEPFAIKDGDQLEIDIDGKVVVVAFQQNDFRIYGASTCDEIVASINRVFESHGLDAFAETFNNPVGGIKQVRIYSGALGLQGSITINGGRAQNVLKFDTVLPETATIGTQWKIETSFPAPTPALAPDRMRLTWIGGTDPQLLNVQIGDYVNIYGEPFHENNRGYFQVLNTTSTYIEVSNISGFNQTTVTQTGANDILFFRPKTFTINSQVYNSFASHLYNELYVKLAATTQAVTRDTSTAAYLNTISGFLLQDRVSITNLTRTGGTTVNITTATNHGLVAGQQFYLYPGQNTVNSKEGVVNQVYTVATAPTGTTLTCLSSGNNILNSDVTYPQYLYPCFKDATGTITLNTTTSNFLTVGSKFIVENLRPDVVRSTLMYNKAINNTITGTSNYGIVKLNDGSVLICGGTNGVTQSACYLYNVTTNTISSAGSMNNARSSGTYILLNNGRVLAVGGNAIAPTSAEVYDPTLNSWALTPNLSQNYSTSYQNMVKLKDGRVLMVSAVGSVQGAEIYDPTANTWTVIPAPSAARARSQLILLNNGTVLLIGGLVSGVESATCEIYNPFTNIWSSTGSMSQARLGHTAMFTNLIGIDGSVLVWGGTNAAANTFYSTAEKYDPVLQTWSTLSSTNPLAAFYIAATPIYNNSKILLAGGINSVTPTYSSAMYVYDILRDKYTLADTGIYQNIGGAFFKPSCVTLNTGDVLFGPSLVGSANNDAFLIRVEDDNIDCHLPNKQFTILTTPASDCVTASVLDELVDEVLTGYTSITTNKDYSSITPLQGVLYPTASPAQTVLNFGPFLIDTVNGLALSKVYTTLNQSIVANTSYLSLAVASTASFSSTGGYLVISFGFKEQIVVQYLGIIDSTHLKLASNVIFNNNIATGASVIALNNSGLPDLTNAINKFIITDSIAGRISASEFIDLSKAAGIKIIKEIVYPGDIGIGNEGQPASGTSKISDKVYVWGTDADVIAGRSS